MQRERQHIIHALPQRRHAHGNYVQAEIEVRAEAPLRDFRAQDAIGRGNNPDIDPARFRRADPQHFAFFEHAKHFRLKVTARFRDLIQEKRASGGPLETSSARRDSSGKGTLFMAEQFALDQAVGKRLAVDRNERPFRAIAPVMQHTRHQLLAGAALPFNHRRGARRRDTPDHCHQLTALRALGDKSRRRTRHVELLPEPVILAPETGHLERARHDRDQLFIVERLGDVIERALPHCGNGAADAGIASQHHHRHIGPAATDFPQQLETVGAVQTYRAQHDVRAALFKRVEGGIAVSSGLGITPGIGQRTRRHQRDLLFFHDQDTCPAVFHRIVHHPSAQHYVFIRAAGSIIAHQCPHINIPMGITWSHGTRAKRTSDRGANQPAKASTVAVFRSARSENVRQDQGSGRLVTSAV